MTEKGFQFYMVHAIYVNDIKYILLYADNSYKTHSIEDRIYYTLCDIFVNIDRIDYALIAMEFMKTFEGGPEGGPEHDNIKEWLACLTKDDFVADSHRPPNLDNIYVGKYIKFEVWYKNVKGLIELL
jgi:hypothetical protein